jgi:hypothetical protein
VAGPRRIDAKVSREFQAVIFAMKTLPTELRRQVRQHVKAIGQQEWTQVMREHALTRVEHRILADTARLSASDQNVRLASATVGKSLQGGLSPKEQYYAAEFGADRNKTASFRQRSPRGRSYQVRGKHTTRQLRPRKRAGYVFGPSAAFIIPQIAALFAQTVVRTVAEGLEGQRG